MHGSRLDFERKPSLTRSQTDSNITYASDEIPEAPGSCCYITKEGDIDLQVVLKVGTVLLHSTVLLLSDVFCKDYLVIFNFLPGRTLGRLEGWQLLHLTSV